MISKWTQIGLTLDATEGDASEGAREGGSLHVVDNGPIGWSHILQGCIGVGIIGFSTLVILLPMRGFGFIGYHPNLFRGTSRGDSPATIVLFIIVVAGMARALFLCYRLTTYLATLVAERSGTVILPAEKGHASSASERSRVPKWLRARD